MINHINMSDDWESEDFNPIIVKPKTDKWDGEDEDDVADSWDAEPEEGDKKAEGDGNEIKATQRKKKKKLADILAEKEERKEEIEKKKAEAEKLRNLTPEEELSEKLKQQRLQEEADLQNAKELFGDTMSSIDTSGLDNIELKSRDDFNSFRRAIVEKMKQYEKSAHYTMFVEDLSRDLSMNMDSD